MIWLCGNCFSWQSHRGAKKTDGQSFPLAYPALACLLVKVKKFQGSKVGKLKCEQGSEDSKGLGTTMDWSGEERELCPAAPDVL